MFGRGGDVGRHPGGHPEGNLLGREIEIWQAACGREFIYWEESCNRSAVFPRCRAGCPGWGLQNCRELGWGGRGAIGLAGVGNL